jgi:hypothetical protein
VGRVELRRRRFELPDGTTDVPVDDLIDLAAAGVSLAAREMCCRAAVDAGSFARAAADLDRLAGLRLSDERSCGRWSRPRGGRCWRGRTTGSWSWTSTPARG